MSPLSLLIKPASGSCNMRCRYCFYTDETEHRETAFLGRMHIDIMHTLVDKALDYADGSCSFVFQGGEPSLAGLDFFRDLSDYINHHPNPKRIQISYCFQTNGYALNEDWCKWFAENKVLVGISLDGPKDLHDRYRGNHQGKGTFGKVMQTIRLMENTVLISTFSPSSTQPMPDAENRSTNFSKTRLPLSAVHRMSGPHR